MRISREALEAMRKKYDAEVRSGRTATNQNGNVIDQTKWIFFDRTTIEKLLEKSDPTTGGIKFYFGEYTTELAKEYFPDNPEAYDGLITLVMSAANLEGDQVEDLDFMERSGDPGAGDFENHGKQCPPTCDPDPTVN
ncbi:hypothetical protein LV84_02733 [Algoriphagus ratkowskyi]|uniref:Molecular chaperone DnaK n=1 Tax=Algoriphagus ratkowskyi TaxID=57028 RepID=A0A2W7R874_9BACT|nr:hypothetical protein [Algoriphagus ratkowskyi]PZX54580.1 hypothetical protein LV84_02733 [Algoriphagus ratkowskyi]TXD76896.1 molecular chaperone DnaK [Algoriphagus ratkowskyi]